MPRSTRLPARRCFADFANLKTTPSRCYVLIRMARSGVDPRHAHLDVDKATSRRMSHMKRRSTAPELAVRTALHRLGIRFRVTNSDLAGSPDLANRARRWAVFVHGCFWHAHSRCALASVPTKNQAFWEAKFAANRRRDREKVRLLRRADFHVVTIWECETYDEKRLAERLRVLRMLRNKV